MVRFSRLPLTEDLRPHYYKATTSDASPLHWQVVFQLDKHVRFSTKASFFLVPVSHL